MERQPYPVPVLRWERSLYMFKCGKQALLFCAGLWPLIFRRAPVYSTERTPTARFVVRWLSALAGWVDRGHMKDLLMTSDA